MGEMMDWPAVRVDMRKRMGVPIVAATATASTITHG